MPAEVRHRSFGHNNPKTNAEEATKWINEQNFMQDQILSITMN
jgi:hypothetical protein